MPRKLIFKATVGDVEFEQTLDPVRDFDMTPDQWINLNKWEKEEIMDDWLNENLRLDWRFNNE